MPKLSRSGQCCQTMRCNNTNTSYYHDDGVAFPFRIKDVQPESCGCQGFGLYCDDELGLLLELPYAGNFTVEYILYRSRKIKISDPNDCFPQKLLVLNLTTTPFRRSRSAEYQIYNCSGSDYPVDDSYEEKIDCLSGLDYTVISDKSSLLDGNTKPSCTFVKQVSVPIGYAYFTKSSLSYYSSVYLTWDRCVTCGKKLHFSILFFFLSLSLFIFSLL
ncbi:putative RING-H2 finger protein ATL21A [Bienertia sinuspersici]